MTREPDSVLDQIRQLFRERGDSGYGGEAVTQLQHALQAAHFARRTGAGSALVAAALLHDVGHLLHDLPEDAPGQGVDDRHEELGSEWLCRWFGAEVAEPVRLHVAAKRYLCAAEPAYERQLSEPSRLSLQLQGGPMPAPEREQFQASPHFSSALLLRRWDDAAKDPELPVPPLEEYLADLRAALLTNFERRGAS